MQVVFSAPRAVDRHGMAIGKIAPIYFAGSARSAPTRMIVLEIVFATLYGLALGSFVNVCISRLPHHRSIVRPRSHCPHCKTPITVRDNIPLLSFALLRGRCRSCGRRISWRYPLVELTTAGLTVACILFFGLDLDGVAGAVFCAFMVALAVCDAETLRLPNALTLPLIGLGILYRFSDGFTQGMRNRAGIALRYGFMLGLRGAISAVATALALLLLAWLYWLMRRRHGMGLGDVKLAAGIAAWLGARQMLVVFFFAVASGALVSLAFLAFRRAKAATETGPYAVPFGTFLASGAIYSLFFGWSTLLWYMHFFT
jgi:leader peptidase (prepilin peptidase) / N-methyltransferase